MSIWRFWIHANENAVGKIKGVRLRLHKGVMRMGWQGVKFGKVAFLLALG